jgi:hypothetical protein
MNCAILRLALAARATFLQLIPLLSLLSNGRCVTNAGGTRILAI